MTTSLQTDADRIEELEAKVATLTTLVERLAPAAQSDVIPATAVEVAPTTSSRRGMLKLAGAAAAGAVAATVAGSVQPAAANAGDNMVLGNAGAGGAVAGTTHQSLFQTRFDWVPFLNNGVGFLFQAGADFTNNSSGFPAALAGWSTLNQSPTGVYGFSNTTDGHGVVGRNNAATGTGVRGISNNGVGVRGESTNGNAVEAEGMTALSAIGENTGVIASASNGDAIIGLSTAGSATRAGIRGLSGVYSIAANLSTRANLFLQPNNNFIGVSLKTAPPLRTDDHLIGEMDNVSGDLWWCVAAGAPGTWRKLSGPGVAGAFHAVTPGRVYDSRQTAPSQGTITGPANRTISVADRRDALLSTGDVIEANFVPAGATAVAANVTVTGTTGSGFLTFNPGGNTTVGSSTINWFGANQDLANGVILTLNAARELTVIAGGGGTTHFIVDITGYYL